MEEIFPGSGADLANMKVQGLLLGGAIVGVVVALMRAVNVVPAGLYKLLCVASFERWG